MKSKLGAVVDERMKEVERQIRADYTAAQERLDEVQWGPDAVKRLTRLVAEIELQRQESRLASLEKLLAVLAGATGEVQEALSELAVKNFERGQDSAYKSIGESLDRLGYNLFGRSWVEEKITEVLEAQYGKGKGNGRKD